MKDIPITGPHPPLFAHQLLLEFSALLLVYSGDKTSWNKEKGTRFYIIQWWMISQARSVWNFNSTYFFLVSHPHAPSIPWKMIIVDTFRNSILYFLFSSMPIIGRAHHLSLSTVASIYARPGSDLQQNLCNVRASFLNWKYEWLLVLTMKGDWGRPCFNFAERKSKFNRYGSRRTPFQFPCWSIRTSFIGKVKTKVFLRSNISSISKKSQRFS